MIGFHADFSGEKALHETALLLFESGTLCTQEAEFIIASVKNFTYLLLILDIWIGKLNETEICEVNLLSVTDADYCGCQSADEMFGFEVLPIVRTVYLN